MKNNDVEIRGENIVFLLGAGASHKAGIPMSEEMVGKVELLINENDDSVVSDCISFAQDQTPPWATRQVIFIRMMVCFERTPVHGVYIFIIWG